MRDLSGRHSGGVSNISRFQNFSAMLRERGIDPLFALIVALPTLIAIIYFGFLATPVYVSESQFVVKSPDKAAPTGVGIVLQSAGFTGGDEELHAVEAFVVSRDALRTLNKDQAFRKAYTRDNIFFLDRFAPFGIDDSFEDLVKYFGGKVLLRSDSRTLVTTLEMRAYDAKSAYRFNKQLLEMSEEMVNRLNERGRADIVATAEREVARAKRESSEAARALGNYRNRSGVVNPEAQSTMQLTMISKLQDQLIATRSELAQIEQLAPDNPRIPVLRRQISEIRGEIANETSKMVGSSRSLSNKTVEFAQLELDNEYAQKQLTTALGALQTARNEAAQKQAYVERIVEPSMPDSPTEPKRWRGILATLLLSLIVYGIARMLAAGVKEHAQ